MRQARDYLSGMTTQLREDIGPEFDDLRQPLSELQKLRGMTPRAALAKHLFDGDDSLFTGNFDRPAVSTPDNVAPQPVTPPPPQQFTGGPAPFDSDAYLAANGGGRLDQKIRQHLLRVEFVGGATHDGDRRLVSELGGEDVLRGGVVVGGGQLDPGRRDAVDLAVREPDSAVPVASGEPDSPT